MDFLIPETTKRPVLFKYDKDACSLTALLQCLSVFVDNDHSCESNETMEMFNLLLHQLNSTTTDVIDCSEMWKIIMNDPFFSPGDTKDSVDILFWLSEHGLDILSKCIGHISRNLFCAQCLRTNVVDEDFLFCPCKAFWYLVSSQLR